MRSTLTKLIALSAVVLLFTGCSAGKKTEPPTPTNPQQSATPAPTEKEQDHISIDKDQITYSVSKKIKYFDKNMIPAASGNTVAGLLVTLSNNTTSPLDIDPANVTITTDDGKKLVYSPEKTAITGKGGFTKHSLLPGYTGGGLVLFELKETAAVTSIEYNDKKGHQVTYSFVNGEAKI